MIITTYAVSGILLAVTGFLFAQGMLTALTQSIAWTVIFFTASCAASSACLTVSEVFPLETRALAISVFYTAGTLIGGVAAPVFFGYLIGNRFAYESSLGLPRRIPSDAHRRRNRSHPGRQSRTPVP